MAAKEETTIDGWVARDKDGCLQLYEKYPQRNDITNDEWGMIRRLAMLPTESFPFVTWETEPLKVKITITPMEE